MFSTERYMHGLFGAHLGTGKDDESKLGKNTENKGGQTMLTQDAAVKTVRNYARLIYT